jgi:cytoskeleton protein RodZ
MTSIGETLRQERLRRDLELEQVSRDLKISPRFLEAIEDEQFEKLPGGVFAKSFVRQYARYLGLDDDEYAAAMQQAVEPAIAGASADAPSVPPVDISLPRVEEWQSVSERRFNWSSSLVALALVVIAMLVCSGVYTWWQRSRRTAQVRDARPQTVQTARVSQPQPQQQTPPQAPTPPVQTPAQTPAAQPEGQQQAATAQPQTVPPATAASTPPVQTPAQQQAATTPDNSATRPATPETTPIGAAVNSVPGATVKVEITATEPVWVSAKSDGKYQFSGTMDTNQTRTIEAKDAVTLRLGNAGGATITLNGKPVGPVGPKGQVRTVQFTSGGFQIVAAPKPSAPDPL